MVAFAPVVQADFSGTAFGGVPTWTDITRFARLHASPISINKWRQDELTDIAPSTMTLVLDNADLPGDVTAPSAGRFTPFLATSPWYPHILPGVRIRAGVTISGTTYWRFDGYVDSWDAAYDNGEFETSTVVANDSLARLGTVDVLRAPVIEEVLLDLPLSFYPLTDAVTATSAADLTGNKADGTVRSSKYGAGTLTFGTAPTMVGMPGSLTVSSPDSNTPTGATQAARATWLQVPNAVPAATTGALEFWFQSPSSIPTSSTEVIFSSFGQVGGNNIFFNSEAYIDQSGRFNISFTGGVWTSSTSVCDGKWHHVVINFNFTGTTSTYFDNALLYISTFNTGGNMGTAPFILGAQVNQSTGATFGPYAGGIALFAQYSANLSTARIAAHYNAGANGFAGEGTAAHITRLLGYRTNLGATLDAGQGTVSTHNFAGETLQQALIDTARAEGGVVYADPATGKIVFLDRKRLRDPAAVLTLDVTAQQTEADLSFRVDTQELYNDVTISRPGGAIQRAVDATSKSTYGTKALSDERIIGSDADAANATGWLLANGKNPRVRTPTLAHDLLSEPNASVATSVLGLLPMQHVGLINLPASAPATDVVIDGCVDTIGVDVLTCSFYTSPLPRPTLRFDAAADSFTKLDAGNVFAW